MSWIVIKGRKGVLKVKPRWQRRWAERNRKVRVIDLGLVIVAWWSASDIERFS